jgi:tetratricopeptide (TPR) repeat protein
MTGLDSMRRFYHASIARKREMTDNGSIIPDMARESMKRFWWAFVLGWIILTAAVVAVSWYAFPDWQTRPGGLWELLGIAAVGTLAFVSGLAALLEKLGVFKPPAAPPAATTSGDFSPIHTGTGNINVTVHEAPPPDPNNSLGSIPPVKAVTYVHRGKIESQVEAFLRSGNGAGAIVGLHAPGGLGKTELAKHAGRELKDQFEGLLWVDVGEKTPPQVVADMLIKCGVQLPPGASYEQQKNELHHRLQDCRLLVILDDVRQKALEGLHDFLPSEPCAVLLTSRIQQIGGVNKTFALDQMTPEQANELLEAVLGADVVAAEKDAAANLAMRCAFNPLALEIAARRARQLQGIKKPIARYFEIVQGRFPELHMDGDARWDMEKVFDISYLDLNEADRKRFRALAAFHPTGFSPDAAAHVWELEINQTRQTLSCFINLSLVKVVEGERERYRLHDLLDEYAGKKLKESGEETSVEIALAEWIIHLFENFYTDDRSTAPQVAEERANLLRCCEWARGQKNGDLLARLITKSRNWFYVSFTEDWIYWIAWLEACLKLGIPDDQLKANVLQAIGDVQQFRKEMDAALASYNEALKLFRAVGAKLGEANVLKAIGDVQQFRKEMDAALASYNEALKLFRAVGAKLGEANVLKAIGDVQQFRDDRDAALASYNEALKLFRAVGAKLGEANVYLSLGATKQSASDIAGARKDFQFALERYQEIGDGYSQARALYRLGDCEKSDGNKEQALKLYKAADAIWRSIGLPDLADQILKPRIDEVS